VVEIDAASNRGVDDARDLRERAMYAPSGEDRYKVYIIDEAHMLTREAWNALLKILEEPPPRVVFVFATTEPQKIAQAAAPVLSRVQRFDLKRIGPADVRERLAAVLKEERVGIEPDALGMLARAADGSMRDALSLADQVLSLGTGDITAQRVRDALGLVHEDEYIALLDIIAEHRAGDVFASVGRLADFGIDFGLLMSGLADTLRAQLAVALGGAVPDLSEHLRAALESRKDRFASADLLRMLTMLVEIEPHFRRSGQQQLLLETLLVRFALLDRTIGLEEILRGLDGAGSSGGGGPARREAPPVAAPRLASPPLMSDSKRVSEPQAAPRAAAKAPEPRVAAKPVVADQPPAERQKKTLDLNRLAEHWEDVVEHVRASGRGMVASALNEATPGAVTAGGVVTIGVTSDALADALQSGSETIIAALRSIFDGVEKVVVKAMTDGQSAARPRLTAENVIADRVATLRKRDPLLNAAIDALDLRLIE
jgi:DNA polymerase-3 subunit gamma/tau